MTLLIIVIVVVLVILVNFIFVQDWKNIQGGWAIQLGIIIPAVIGAIGGILKISEQIIIIFSKSGLDTPIRKIKLEDIAKKVHPGVETKWIDRETLRFETLLHDENLRIFIQGPRSIGKTREAYELIKRFIIAGRISDDNLYEFIPFLIKSGISSEIISRYIDDDQNALLLIDDLPKHYPEKTLDNLTDAFKGFKENQNLIIIATGRSEQMRKTKHRDWLLENQFELFSFDKIRGRDVQHIIIDICEKNDIELDEEAKQVFRKRLRACTPGIVHLLIRGKKASQVSRITEEMAEELVQEIRKQEFYEFNDLLKKRQEVAVLLQSVTVFDRCDVRPYTSLVLSYAYHLWGKHHPNSNPRKMKPIFKDAIQILESYGNMDEEDFQLADVLLEQLDPVESRKSLSDFLLQHNRLLQHPWLRVIYGEADQHAKALFTLGVYFHEENDLQRAILLFSAALKMNPYAFIYTSRGITYGEAGNLDQAIQDFAKAIKQDPNDALGYTNRGTAYFFKEDNSRAIADYNKAIELDPDDAIVYINRANSLMRCRQLDAAEEDCNKAEKLAPEHPYTHARRALLHFLLGEYDAALEKFSTAQSLEDDATEFHFDTALPLLCLGKNDEALRLIKERLEQGTEPYEIKDALFWYEDLKARQPDLPGLDEALALLKGKN